MHFVNTNAIYAAWHTAKTLGPRGRSDRKNCVNITSFSDKYLNYLFRKSLLGCSIVFSKGHTKSHFIWISREGNRVKIDLTFSSLFLHSCKWHDLFTITRSKFISKVLHWKVYTHRWKISTQRTRATLDLNKMQTQNK